MNADICSFRMTILAMSRFKMVRIGSFCLQFVVGWAAMILCAERAGGEDIWKADYWRDISAALERVETFIYVPRESHSLEWVVDSSDAIVIAEISLKNGEAVVKDVLKPDSGRVPWPPDDTVRLGAIIDLYRPGDKVLFCLRTDKEKKSSKIYHYFPLLAADDPRRAKDLWDDFSLTLPKEMDRSTQMYLCRRRRWAGFVFLAVDKGGGMTTDAEDLVARIRARIAAGSRLPADCDREAVEKGESVYGGFYIHVKLDSAISPAEFPTVLLPPEPEFRGLFFTEPVRTADHDPKASPGLPPELINYKDEEVITSLNRHLSEPTITQEGRRVSDNGLVEFIWYKLNDGERPRKVKVEDDGTVKVVRTYVYRKQAYELLQAMKVEVEKPVLTVE